MINLYLLLFLLGPHLNIYHSQFFFNGRFTMPTHVARLPSGERFKNNFLFIIWERPSLQVFDHWISQNKSDVVIFLYMLLTWSWWFIGFFDCFLVSKLFLLAEQVLFDLTCFVNFIFSPVLLSLSISLHRLIVLGIANFCASRQFHLIENVGKTNF